MTGSPTLADLIADPGELDVSCLSCRHNTTMRWRPCCLAMPLKCRFLRCGRVPLFGLWISRRIDVRPHWVPTKHNPAIAAWTGYRRIGKDAAVMVVAAGRR